MEHKNNFYLTGVHPIKEKVIRFKDIIFLLWDGLIDIEITFKTFIFRRLRQKNKDFDLIERSRECYGIFKNLVEPLRIFSRYI